MKDRSTINDYSFSVKPDKSMWVMQLPTGRLMGKGNPYRDKYFRKYLNGLDGGRVSKKLRPLLKKYRIQDEPVLLDADKGGFKFIKGEVGYRIDAISLLLKKLIDSYCHK